MSELPPGDFVNATGTGDIPSFDGRDEKARATDFANYFCSYAQLYHQKQMLADHNRMAAYHAAIMGNATVFKDKVVMDVGTGSGILAVWAAQAGARRVYAVEYTDMAKHARSVMEANGVADIVTVIQGAVEDVVLEEKVDVMISEWMGYFLLRESMLDSLIRARDSFLRPDTGLMFPSHATMFLAPITDEDERKVVTTQEYNNAMADWNEFAETTKAVYGVDMSVLEPDFEREQREYYLLSSRWTELRPDAVLSQPVVVKEFDMSTCTLADSRGVTAAPFSFDITDAPTTVSGFAGWFTADFKSRTDTDLAPKLPNPAHLSTGPDNGFTHWGQQTFYLLNSIPVIAGETTSINGTLDMTRSRDNARLYNCRISFTSVRRKKGITIMKAQPLELIYQIP